MDTEGRGEKKSRKRYKEIEGTKKTKNTGLDKTLLVDLFAVGPPTMPVVERNSLGLRLG